MPDFPSRADGAVPPVGDSALDELLTAGSLPQDAAAELQPVAAVLAALRAGPADGELAGQARVLAEFRGTVRVSHRAGRSRARRPVPPRERLSSRLAVITTAAAVAVSGTAIVAYVGALPPPLQQAAHDVFAFAPEGGAQGHPVPATSRARPLHSSAAPISSPVSSSPGSLPGQAGSARKQHGHKHHGRHGDHKGQRAARHRQGAQGNQNSDGPAARPDASPMASDTGSRYGAGLAARRDANQIAHHKGSPLQLPLPRAAASRYRLQVPTGRGPAGAEPRARVPTPGGPGPRSFH